MDTIFQDTQDAEKIDHWNFVNADFAVTNMHDDASKNYGESKAFTVIKYYSVTFFLNCLRKLLKSMNSII